MSYLNAVSTGGYFGVWAPLGGSALSLLLYIKDELGAHLIRHQRQTIKKIISDRLGAASAERLGWDKIHNCNEFLHRLLTGGKKCSAAVGFFYSVNLAIFTPRRLKINRRRSVATRSVSGARRRSHWTGSK